MILVLPSITAALAGAEFKHSFAFGLLAAFVAGAFCYMLEVRRLAYLNEPYEREYQRWLNTVMCHRCGATWQRIPGSTPVK